MSNHRLRVPVVLSEAEGSYIRTSYGLLLGGG